MRTHRLRVITLVMITTVFLTGTAPSSTWATPFVKEIVDTYGGQYTSLALDSRGNPHISYYSGPSGRLQYAYRQNGYWAIETVDATGGADTSLELDAEGVPHISYATGSGLMYATKVGAEWDITIVDVAGVGPTSLALTSEGYPRICYVADGSYKYIAWSGSSWLGAETVDGAPLISAVSLAVDSEGNPHICYRTTAPLGTLGYASKVGGSWSLRTADSNAGAGYSCSIALDTQGHPHVAYTVGGDLELRYARNLDGWAWDIEIVESGRTYDYVSLALNANGEPRISYWVFGLDVLTYAVRSGVTWTTETVDATGDVGHYTSLALDAQGNPHISYYDNSNGILKFADAAVRLLSPIGRERWAVGSVQTVRWSGGGTVDVQLSTDGGGTYTTILSSISSHAVSITVPSHTTEHARIRVSRSSPYSTSDSPCYFSIAPGLVDPWWTEILNDGGPAEYGSLALSAQGEPRISYYDPLNRDLRYAGRVGGVWQTEMLDGLAGDVGLSNSLALDAEGDPHISYHDHTNGALKYIWMEDGVWQSPLTLDDGGGADVGWSCSLSLDAQGNAHVGYLDVTNYRVKYVRVVGGVPMLPEIVATVTWEPQVELALDSQGNPHIGYASNDGVYYTMNVGGVWTTPETVCLGWDEDGLAMALDAKDEPHFVYNRADGLNWELEYRRKLDGVWTRPERVEAQGGLRLYFSLALDGEGNPHLTYTSEFLASEVYYVSRFCGTWMTERLGGGGPSSLALDDQGNPHVCSSPPIVGGPQKYVSAAVELGDPAPDVTWPVGASRTVTWEGTGLVDLYLSVDGGNSWLLQETGLAGGSYRWIVPHTPTKFAQVKLERAIPPSRAKTAGLFTIETTVTLLAMLAAPAPLGAGVVVTWETDPGPEDLAGYRLEKSDVGRDRWRAVQSLTRETSVTDPSGGPGTRYRLFAVNGLGEELWLGETSMRPARPLTAWPLPYRGGDLTISFATYGGLGGGSSPAEVAVYDVQGRLVRRIAQGSYPAGYQSAVWDGRDDRDRDVAAGVYLLRAESLGQSKTVKLAVLR